jgi:hypothetical protein
MFNMQKNSWELSLLVLVTSFNLIGCGNSDPPPPPLSATAKAGFVQLVNWNELHPEVGSYQIKTQGVAAITFGSIDNTGHLSYKLPDTLNFEAAASQWFGTACNMTPANSTFVPAVFYVKSQNDPASHLLFTAKLKSSNALSVNDQALGSWIYAPKAFSVKGAKNCAPQFVNISFDLQFQQGWNNIINTVISLSPDGKQITELQMTATNATIPTDFVWKQDSNGVNVLSTNTLDVTALKFSQTMRLNTKP